jgi:NAD(P)-dependent dehydrogenase (short-subunit alcohol dehydrogenase family)
MTNVSPVALVHGAGCSLGNELAAILGAQGMRVVLYDQHHREQACEDTAAKIRAFGGNADALPATLSNSNIIAETVKLHGRIDLLFNCLVPGVGTAVASLFSYPQELFFRNLSAAEAMVACGTPGAIVNQCFVGALFQDTPLEAAIVMARGAISSATREICCKFGKAGIRINNIQLGLIDLPEVKALATEKTLSRKPPVGRWGTAAEVAKFMIFLGARNGYMTGQSICFDGGQTAGNTGI